MSDTTATAPTAQPVTSRLSEWGAIAVSIVTLVAFSTALVIAYYKGDQTSISLLVGAVVANSSTVVSFWLGSSRGSQAKDAALAAAAAAPATTTGTHTP